jgi:trk system potassium uptake protein TrkA
MRIVIAGAGAVGFHLARELGVEGHHIAIIDVDADKLEYLRDRLDVLTVQGSATRRSSLEAAGAPDADLFIAVSSEDEVNMLACAAAHSLGVRRTLARVRNPDFVSESPLVDPVKLGITRFINPDEIAVDSIVALVDAPGSIDVGDFAGGRIFLRSFDLDERSVLCGRPLHRLKEDYSGQEFLVASIQRGGQHIVPTGDHQMEPGDRVFMLMTETSLPIFRKVVSGTDRVQRVVVYGAEQLGIAVSRQLQGRTNVVLIDEDRDRCQQAASELDDTLVLNGSPNDSDIQGQGRLTSADFFISAGRNEEHNLILALLAKKRGARRNIVVTADPDIVSLLDSLDIDAVINPRLTMVGRLLRYARGGRVQAVQKIGESTAEVIEMVVRHGAKAVGVMLKDLKLPNGALVGAIMRDKEAFIPHGRTEVREGDVVVCFVLPGLRDRVERLFARRGGLNFAGEGSPPSAAESEESRPSGEPVAVTEPEDVSDVDDASPDKA